ncbi:MAG: WD domain, G-beta repeat [bacterium ADurb.Bin363]|nr:MAG: WD domain, G-beta repeat [bacterium ADurb.Bin363]
MLQIPWSDLNLKLNKLVLEELNKWPLPLSVRMASLLEEEIEKKVLSTVAFLNFLSFFLGSLLIALYINEPQQKFENNNLNRLIVEKFFTKPPSTSEWISIIRESLKYCKDEKDFFIPELQQFFCGISDPLEVIEKVRITGIDKEKGLLEELNSFRLCIENYKNISAYLKKYDINHEVKNKETLIKGYELVLPFVLANLYRLIYGLRFFSDYQLFYIKNLKKEVAEISLYSFPEPSCVEVNITELERDFAPHIFLYKLFLGRVIKTAENSSVSPVTTVKTAELNPLFINWEKESTYLPHSFLFWRKKHTIFIRDIISQKGKKEIDHIDTCEGLRAIFRELKKRLHMPLEDETEREESVTLLQSKERYRILRKEIYTLLNITEEIDGKKEDKIIPLTVSLVSTEEEENQNKSERLSLREAVKKQWNKKGKWHCLLLGERGSGKTVSLLKLWESFLAVKGPVPIFLSLNKYNREEQNSIWERISLEYRNQIYSDREQMIMKKHFMKVRKVYICDKSSLSSFYYSLKKYVMESDTIKWREYPSVILILDGLNEIRNNKSDFLSCLKTLTELKGLQIIISSDETLNLPDFQILKLEELDDERIKTFMSCRGIDFTIELVKKIPLLRNPMILTLYCYIEKTAGMRSTKEISDFIPHPRYRGEILHNFIISFLVRMAQIKPSEKFWHNLCIKQILPRAGYEMEKNGFLDITCERLIEIINEELHSIRNMTQENTINKEPEEIIKMFKEIFFLLREISGHTYTFIHEDFRDYFAALYIKQKIKERIDLQVSSFPELSYRLLGVYLRSILGELTGEPKRSPFIKGTYREGELKETLLDLALNLLKHKEKRVGDYSILNIIEILKEKRVDLSNTLLYCLDLRNVFLNNVKLGHGEIDGKYRGSVLKGSKVKSSTFFPPEKNKTMEVRNVTYSPDGKRLLSGGMDKTIKEWDVSKGKCLRIYEGHKGWITSVDYSPDGRRLISGSDDKTIREWDVFTGECIGLYRGHTHWITSVHYSPDGKKLVSGSSDKTIREWNILTGECIKTYRGHNHWVNSVHYSPGGKKIISGSSDETVREWNILTGECIRTYVDSHKITSVNYSSDGKKIISGNSSGRIKEWHGDTGECLRIYEGHFGRISSVSYSHDGAKILSASQDGTIREWNTTTGECLRTYEGHSSWVNSVHYSPDGSRVVSGGEDKTIKEWNVFTGECIRSILNIPGLLLQGVDMSEVHPDSELIEEEVELLKYYGAIL